MIRIKMLPHPDDYKEYDNGIAQVVVNYARYCRDAGFEIMPKSGGDYDLRVAHAGITGRECDVAILHGLYFTADYQANSYEYRANQTIVDAVRSSKAITVPSNWVSEIIKRDMKRVPYVIPHGINWQEWTHKYQHENYILWAKNRPTDVCTTKHLKELSRLFPNVNFVSTFPTDPNSSNIKVIGVQPHSEMKKIIQKSGVYLSTTKETFGIATLEAMASGVPILGFRQGGNCDLVEHGVNGYLANAYDYEDLANGLEYCMKYRDILGSNGIEVAKKWTWQNAVSKLYTVFENVLTENSYIPSVTCVIPTYNYAGTITRAIESVKNQELKVEEIIVVDDGSTDNTEDIVVSNIPIGKIPIRYIKQSNAGVANARNRGVSEARTKYVFCLDPDDAIEPLFTRVCVEALEKDQALGIAYTGLKWIKPDGSSGISDWPGEWDFDEQLKRHNQVPTCCVFRKSMWDNLGGQRQRYAPLGAGSEDAEFWTRSGAYGYKAKKVTDLPLFVYSWGSGRVSGNKDYKEVDWLAWHPWSRDKNHPFASYAKPEKLSHPVRQYDEPVVSVIIPVGTGHEKNVVDALDSLEAQTFRKWECIVVWDSQNVDIPDNITKAYPYVRFIHTPSPKSGPGKARNDGVKVARSNFIIFLDADDYLLPDAILTYIEAWNKSDSIIYSDYLGKAVMDEASLVNIQDRVVDYNRKTHEVIMKHNSADYNCGKAQDQPDKDIYHWCLVTCLIPRAWHNAIGGFDESMRTFEDVDYHWRLAREGYCYARVSVPLVMYNFSSGNRREIATSYTEEGRQTARTMLEYMHEKYRTIKKMPCKKCGGQNSAIVIEPTRRYDSRSVSEKDSKMSDVDFVECLYTHDNKGDHRVIGPETRIDYGYRSGGDIFLVNIKDVGAAPHLFKRIIKDVVNTESPVVQSAPIPKPVEVPKPIEMKPEEVKSKEPFFVDKEGSVPTGGFEKRRLLDLTDLQLIPGINDNLEIELHGMGIVNAQQVLELGESGLTEIKFIGTKRAKMIIGAINKIKENDYPD